MNFKVHISEGSFSGGVRDAMWIPYGDDLRVHICDDDPPKWGEYEFSFVIKKDKANKIGELILEGIAKIKKKKAGASVMLPTITAIHGP